MKKNISFSYYAYLTGIMQIATKKLKILVHLELMSLEGLVTTPIKLLSVIVILFFETILKHFKPANKILCKVEPAFSAIQVLMHSFFFRGLTICCIIFIF